MGGHLQVVTARVQLKRPEPNPSSSLELPSEWVQRSYELAYFIISDHSKAIDIITGALEKLRVQSRRETKRHYWRDKHPEKPVRRMTRDDLDLLQWLVMYEAEQHERDQEQAGSPSQQSMAIRYVKYLVQITTAMSSFQVCVGLSRLLHNYKTGETQQIYEWLMHRYLGSDEYRRSKGVLMHKLAARFDAFVRTCRAEHGETKFEAAADQSNWTKVVADSLTAFTPWSTEGRCSEAWQQFVTAVNEPAGHNSESDGNERELRCSHTLIEPACYSRLIKELALDPPETRLALPRFFMTEHHEMNDGQAPRSPAPKLSEMDHQLVRQRLAASDERRKKISSRFVVVLVDRVLRGQIDLTQMDQLDIPLEEDAKVVELWGEDGQGKLLLATHFITEAEKQSETSQSRTILNGAALELKVNPAAVGAYDTRAKMILQRIPVSRITQTQAIWSFLFNARWPVRGYALAALVLGLILAITSTIYLSRRTRNVEQARPPVQKPEPAPQAPRGVVSYAMIPDDQRVRAPEEPGVPIISVNARPPVINLELRLSPAMKSDSYTAELKTFAGDRTFLTQTGLRPRQTPAGRVIEIVFPADLLDAGTYYTVSLSASGLTDRFTFKVVSSQ